MRGSSTGTLTRHHLILGFRRSSLGWSTPSARWRPWWACSSTTSASRTTRSGASSSTRSSCTACRASWTSPSCSGGTSPSVSPMRPSSPWRSASLAWSAASG
uniref:Uncharacterized protein n=1 Tax=Arundo donax TaxID=35708 RepID=A0A0A9GVH4_ARUDO